MSNLLARETNFNLCIFCQDHNRSLQPLVRDPQTHSYNKVFTCIVQRSSYEEDLYTKIISRLNGQTAETLEKNNASWHRKCYDSATNATEIKRSKCRFDKLNNDSNVDDNSISQVKSDLGEASTSQSNPNTLFTRSKTTPYNNQICFFCDKSASRLSPLHKVSYDSAGKNLKSAVMASKNEKLIIKLNTAINTEDAHAIDIRYHLLCWTTNVKNMSRNSCDSDAQVDERNTSNLAADIEFISLLEQELENGNIISMSLLETTYGYIREKNLVANTRTCRKKLKQMISEEIQGVEFHVSSKRNEAEKVSLKRARDRAVNHSKSENDEDMRSLFNAANELRNSVEKAKKWNYNGSL